MKASGFLVIIQSHDPCEPGINWLKEQLQENPDVTVAELWSKALDLNEKIGGVADTHLGKSWLAWIARMVAQVPCGTGVYSGRPKIHEGPSVEKLNPDEVAEHIAMMAVLR